MAERLGWQAVDADEEIVRQAGKPIAAIFADDGEAGFRDLEERVVADLCGRVSTVIALGGGAVLREATRRRLSVAGPVAWLQGDAATLAARITADTGTAANRPRLTDAASVEEETRRLLAEREPLYAECATVALDTSVLSAEAVADRLAEWLRTRC